MSGLGIYPYSTEISKQILVLSLALMLCFSAVLAPSFGTLVYASPKHVQSYLQLPSSGQPPTEYNITVYVQRVKQKDNLDPDPFGWLGAPNRADFYIKATIDGVELSGPKIDGADDAYFDYTFSQSVDPFVDPTKPKLEYSIKIKVRESDVKYDDPVDINPQSGKKDLELTFNALSYRFRGDASGTGGNVYKITGAGDKNRATIWFSIGTADGRPFSKEDLATTKLDVVQVVFGASSLVTGKPAIVMIRLVNNFDHSIETTLRLTVSGAASRTLDVKVDPPLAPWDVREMFLLVDDPLIPQTGRLQVRAEIDPDNEISGPGIDPDENNLISNEWKVKQTKNLRLLYMRFDLDTALVGGGFTPTEGQLRNDAELNDAFINATYPMNSLTSVVSDDILYIPTGGVGYMAGPAAGIIVYANLAPLLGYDRLVGVVHRNWFETIPGWGGVAGLSMDKWITTAVIVTEGRQTTVAHEVGHTFGLSVDPRLGYKYEEIPLLTPNAWDEYTLSPGYDGNPSNGFWLPQGGEPAVIIPLLNQEQTDLPCFMGTSPLNPFQDWASRGRWIDNADYEHLLEALSLEPDPEVVHVSGLIFRNDTAYLLPWYRLTEGIPDLALDPEGGYSFRFLSSGGEILAEAGFKPGFIPKDFNPIAPDINRTLDFLSFGFTVPFPAGTKRIQIINRQIEKVITERIVSENPPSINIVSPKAGETITAGQTYTIKWNGSDTDDDPLSYTVAFSHDEGESWLPLGHMLNETTFTWNTTDLKEDSQYLIKVIATDGVNTEETVSGPFIIKAAVTPTPKPSVLDRLNEFLYGIPVVEDVVLTLDSLAPGYGGVIFVVGIAVAGIVVAVPLLLKRRR